MIKDIVRIQYAESTIPESWIFSGGDDQKRVPIVFSIFLIITDDRIILVDPGCETMPGFDMKNFETPMAALKKKGFETTDVTDVVITHAHHDHIECVKYFEDATIYIQQQELLKGAKYLHKDMRICPFSDRMVVEDNVIIQLVGGHSIGSSVVECEMNGKKYVLCGDECYSLINLSKQIPTAKPYSQSKSKGFVQKYGSSEYICLLCHDV